MEMMGYPEQMECLEKWEMKEQKVLMEPLAPAQQASFQNIETIVKKELLFFS